MFILTGEDDFSISQALGDIKRELGDPALLVTNTVALEGQRLTLGELRTVCETMPFMGEKRLVIVTGLLQRFESGGKPRRKKKRVESALA